MNRLQYSVKAYFQDRIELKYQKVDAQSMKERLPLLKVDGKVVKEGCIPDMSMIMEYAQRAGVAG
ncbi:MAG: hypothetical protein RDV48_01280 [Candidatus Eremiobacteraeota bacterium]|nr:hypothetical protein [Candidatus Eremiobacteraeota bacterium]